MASVLYPIIHHSILSFLLLQTVHNCVAYIQNGSYDFLILTMQIKV